LEENQVLTILKELIVTVEEYVGDIETVKLDKREKGKSYTSDRIVICGVSKGRKFELELDFEDADEVD
jgi:hypothetical protein